MESGENSHPEATISTTVEIPQANSNSSPLPEASPSGHVVVVNNPPTPSQTEENPQNLHLILGEMRERMGRLEGLLAGLAAPPEEPEKPEPVEEIPVEPMEEPLSEPQKTPTGSPLLRLLGLQKR